MNTYSEPQWDGIRWTIVESNPDGEPVAEYGYPIESAAWAAYRALTGVA